MQVVVEQLSEQPQWSEERYQGPQRQLLFALANRIQNDEASKRLICVLHCLLRVICVNVVVNHVH